ncbi:MAG: DoxX family protein [Flavobacteriaceae bacterium]|nr:DoxX family protein [Flavobacteriaceae bacterium]
MRNKILFVLSILFGLMFINSGLNKFFNFIPVPDDLPESLARLTAALAEIGWLLPLIGGIEVLAGLLFMIPKYRALGAAMIFPIMIGIMLTHTITDTSGLPVAIVLFAINVWVIFENRKKYLPMIQ